MIGEYFQFAENRTTLRREMLAGATTFATMAYIIFVNPAILSTTGMDFGAVMVATCLASALGTLLMALLANYPIALAPGMGLNAYFAFTICGALGLSWQTALGGVFVSGISFLLLSLFRFREKIIAAIPDALKHAIAIGIGLFIAFIGLKQGGLIRSDPATFVTMGDLRQPVPLLMLLGLFITAVMLVRGIIGALLIGMLVTGSVAGLSGLLEFHGIFSLPPPIAPTLLQLDILGAIEHGFFTVIVIFLFVDLFDTVGTLVAVGEQGGFMREGRLPRAGRAFFADALATSAGSVLGTSTTTAYIESASGISEGGRTGFASVVTALLFLAALFFAPLVEMLGQGIDAGGEKFYPITAPALVVVGSLMLANSMKINWKDYAQSIPAFLVIVGIPLSFSIADGMAFGFMAYPAIHVLAGRWREVGLPMYVLGVVFGIKYFAL